MAIVGIYTGGYTGDISSGYLIEYILGNQHCDRIGNVHFISRLAPLATSQCPTFGSVNLPTLTFLAMKCRTQSHQFPQRICCHGLQSWLPKGNQSGSQVVDLGFVSSNRRYIYIYPSQTQQVVSHWLNRIKTHPFRGPLPIKNHPSAPTWAKEMVSLHISRWFAQDFFSTRCRCAAVGVHPAVRAVARLRGAEANLGHEASPGRLAGRQRAQPGHHRCGVLDGPWVPKMGDFLRIFFWV